MFVPNRRFDVAIQKCLQRARQALALTGILKPADHGRHVGLHFAQLIGHYRIIFPGRKSVFQRPCHGEVAANLGHGNIGFGKHFRDLVGIAVEQLGEHDILGRVTEIALLQVVRREAQRRWAYRASSPETIRTGTMV